MLLPFALTAIAIVFGFFVVVKKAASKYFVVDAGFKNYDSRHRMSIGDGGGDMECAGCGRSGTKKCSRCKSVRYCSQACQSKHWEEHKLKCRQVKSSNNLNSDSSGDSVYRRKKSPGFGSISLVPARGSCKVLQEPKKILFPYDEFIKLFKWDKPGFPPCGLLNCGNSCFANVVLQCLTCTRPLTAYLLEKDHGRTCIRKQEDWCFLCELQTHIQRASKSQQPFSPANILSRIPNIGGNLGYGSQEDAHEFMRFAIDTMQSVCLDEHGGEKALEPSTQETTLIQYIFGGHLQSQCIPCKQSSKIKMRREGRQHGLVRAHTILPGTNSRVLNQLEGPTTAGMFTKVSLKPTNHSKFTGRCTKSACASFHDRHVCKSKAKEKGGKKFDALVDYDEGENEDDFGISED